MKSLIVVAVACAGLGGCVAVPVGEPSVHISGTVMSEPVYQRPYPYVYGPAYRAPYPHGYYQGPPRGYYGRRDADGDGVPNRYDRRPRNPYRY